MTRPLRHRPWGVLRRPWHVAAVLLALGAVKLCGTGITWGLPTPHYSWSPDSIAGLRALGTAGDWPSHWSVKYPPTHYLITNLMYAPLRAWWRARDLVRTNPQTGLEYFVPPFAPKVSALILASRLLTLGMAVGTVLAVWWAGSLLYGDRAAGFAAATCLLFVPEFVLYAHWGTLDVPSLMWLALSLCFYARAGQHGRRFDYALLGITAALAVSTKDAVAGAYVGMAAVLAFKAPANRATASLTMVLRRTVRANLWLGLACFLLPYALLSGWFTNLDGYVDRLRGWFAGGHDTARWVAAYRGQLWLLGETAAQAVRCLGWPMTLAMVVSVVIALYRDRRRTLFIVAPVVTYYAVVIVPLHFVVGRFLLPTFICGAIVLGHGCVSVLRQTGVPLAARAGLMAWLFVPTLACAVAVDLELLHDSRYDAEAWMAEHIPSGTTVGVFAHEQYLPRLAELGLRARRLSYRESTFTEPLLDVLVSTGFERFDPRGETGRWRSALLRGKTDFEPVATFAGHYLGRVRRWLLIGGIGDRDVVKVSPDIVVLIRRAPVGPASPI